MKKIKSPSVNGKLTERSLAEWVGKLFGHMRQEYAIGVIPD